MNGILITSNPRFALRNSHLAELVISSIELSDTGQYECRTDHTIRYIVHLLAVKRESSSPELMHSKDRRSLR